MQFHHVGVPTDEIIADALYVDTVKVHITDPERHPLRFEFCRPEPDTLLPEVLQTNPHIAYVVEDLEAAVGDDEVLVAPMLALPGIRIAFVRKNGVCVEYLQMV